MTKKRPFNDRTNTGNPEWVRWTHLAHSGSQSIILQDLLYLALGLKIATDTVTNVTNIFSLVTKNSGLVATLAIRFLCALDLD